MRPGPYRADLRFVYTSPYVRTTTTRGHGGARGRCRRRRRRRVRRYEPIAESEFASPALLDIRGYSRQTSLPKRVLPPSVSFPFPLVIPSRSFRSHPLALNVRYHEMRRLPNSSCLRSISIARFCRDACDASRVLSLTNIGRMFLYSRDICGIYFFLISLSHSLLIRFFLLRNIQATTPNYVF